MGKVECDRCGEQRANVAMWDDDVLSGRMDAICEECYKNDHRITRPIEPPYNEDGELYHHVRMVDCPLCNAVHDVHITDTIAVCPFNRIAPAPDGVYDVTDEIIMEEGI